MKYEWYYELLLCSIKVKMLKKLQYKINGEKLLLSYVNIEHLMGIYNHLQ